MRLNVFNIGLKRSLNAFIHVYLVELSLIDSGFLIIQGYLSLSSNFGLLQCGLSLSYII
ncbi:hypothetical protein BDV23DRAFT_160193 [Aspergillus alliaceus]|uniref:Uncharacterized protein n=1 Tax=Petromyces alliaceus TaxID=209559 RepID=A0A5N7C1E0_PETAA|nr:hypothetical protein BDV23DRAFT_160193 [Aspergillus alliaceus]